MYRYILEGNEYVLLRKRGFNAVEEEITLRTEEVGICFSKDDWVFHKHGRPDLVEKWYRETVEKMRQTDGIGIEMANNLIYMQGKFDVEHLNKCLTHTGYIKRFCEDYLELEL